MKFYCSIYEDEAEEEKPFEADIPEDAAERFREYHDPRQAEYPLCETIYVRDESGNKWSVEVHLETVPEYRAEKARKLP